MGKKRQCEGIQHVKYNQYAATNKSVSLLGFGSIRFSQNDIVDDDGLWRCAMLVRYANRCGINFFDVAPTYANNKAHTIFSYAFHEMENDFYISDKSSMIYDKTADDVYRRIINSITIMRVPKIHFFNMWSIMNIEHYKKIMEKDGPYEGALRAKREGLIDHIVCSTHASVTDNLKIIEDGFFEGITISLNVMTYTSQQPVIELAAEKGMAVVSMNPLGGGVISSNPEFFKFLICDNDSSTASEALRYVASIPGVTTVLSGMSSKQEVDENVESLLDETRYSNRYKNVNKIMQTGSMQICTGCNYCNDCPVGIPISAYMKSYNCVFFPEVEYMGQKVKYDDKEQNDCYKVFSHLKLNYDIIPFSSDNECIHCGLCEEKCTQKLPIMTRLSEIMELSNKFEYNVQCFFLRVSKIVEDSETKQIGFYPAGEYSSSLYDLCRPLFNEKGVALHIYDKDPDKWYKQFFDLTIQPPDKIRDTVDTVIITSYQYKNEIYDELKHYEDDGILIRKLHKDTDIRWFY